MNNFRIIEEVLYCRIELIGIFFDNDKIFKIDYNLIIFFIGYLKLYVIKKNKLKIN